MHVWRGEGKARNQRKKCEKGWEENWVLKQCFLFLFGHFKSFKIGGTTQQEGDLPKTFPSPP